ncbi:MAG: MFS transporter [Steroidobacteraceae bacterium]|nr:MFS transporter [Steroidobacteraceae bacterium]MCW5573198.1 MFS transporter [Steroidobacteraceae bacterium]
MSTSLSSVPAQDETPSDWRRYRALAAASFGLALGYSNIAILCFGLFVVPLSAAYGWSRSEISLAMGILLWLVVITGPSAGALIDRFGARRILIPSIILFALAFASLALVNGRLWLFYAIHVALAVVGAGTLPSSYTHVIVGWFDKRRGLALGITMAGVGIGGFFLPPYVQALLARGGLQTAYLGVAALVALVCLPVVVLFLKEPPVPAGRQTSETSPLRELFANPRFIKLASAFFLLGLYTAGMLGHLVPLLVDRGVDPVFAAWTMSMLAATLTLGRVFAGYLLDRFSPMIVVSVFLAAPVAGLVLLAGGASGDVAIPSAILLGFGIGAEFDFMCYLVSRYLPAQTYARNYGITYAAYAVGAGLGPILLSFSLEKLGAYAPALWLLCGTTLAAILILLTLGNYRRTSG